jgi:voltage-gated potassium channel
MKRPKQSRTRPLWFRRSVVRDLRNRIRFALVGLLLLVGLHVVSMIAFEHLGLGEAIWLTFTTITTTDYPASRNGQFVPGRMAGSATNLAPC